MVSYLTETSTNGWQRTMLVLPMQIFADWLVETYGVDALRAGSGIVDVAGGNGNLAFELMKRGFRVTIIDPRFDPNKRTRTQRKWMKKQAKRARRFANVYGRRKGGRAGPGGGGFGVAEETFVIRRSCPCQVHFQL